VNKHAGHKSASLKLGLEEHSFPAANVGSELLPRAPLTFTVLEKRYTKDHEWVELSGDGKTGEIEKHGLRTWF
jgi:hypothetical protein